MKNKRKPDMIKIACTDIFGEVVQIEAHRLEWEYYLQSPQRLKETDIEEEQ